MKLNEVISDTMQFWHGGNLDEETSPKTGRWEYGPGLYLITHYSTAKKYAKGGRKLYKITVETGRDSSEISIHIDNIKSFVNMYCIGSKKKDILTNLTKYIQNDSVSADILINIVINYEGLKNSNARYFRDFLISSGVDYTIVKNPFGWNDEKMMVLYNMNKIVKTQVIKPTDKIEQFSLNK